MTLSDAQAGYVDAPREERDALDSQATARWCVDQAPEVDDLRRQLSAVNKRQVDTAELVEFIEREAGRSRAAGERARVASIQVVAGLISL